MMLWHHIFPFLSHHMSISPKMATHRLLTCLRRVKRTWDAELNVIFTNCREDNAMGGRGIIHNSSRVGLGGLNLNQPLSELD